MSASKALYEARLGLFVFSAFYTVAFAGAFFGWGPMQLMLEADGAFSDKCVDSVNTDEVCPAQTKSLLNVQLIAQLMQMCTPLLGHLCDTRGPTSLMVFVSSIGCLGISLLMVASATGLDRLLFVAFSCLGLMAVSASVLMVQAGMVFEGEVSQRRAISALNALFDAGSITYLGLWAIGNSIDSDSSLLIVSGGYLGLAVVCFGGSLYFWRRVTLLMSKTSLVAFEPGVEDEEIPVASASKHSSRDGEEDGSSSPSTLVDEVPPNSTDIEDESIASELVMPTSGYVPISMRTTYQQLTSGEFLLLSVFFAFNVARNIFVLTTARDFLAYLGDDATGNKYLTIFTLLMPASVLGLPCVDVAIKRFGWNAGFQLINVLAIAHGIIQVASDNLNVQVLGFIIFSCYRCFLFTVTFSFLPVFMGSDVLGKAAGLLMFFAGFSTLINIPLANVAIDVFNGNFFWSNLFYTILIIPFIYVAWKLENGLQREGEAKNKDMVTPELPHDVR